METLLEWANILHDEITGVVCYCAKTPGILAVHIFVTRVIKMMSFYSFDHLRKMCIP